MATEELGNCWGGNIFTTSAPQNLENLAPCEGQGSGDWTLGVLNVLTWLADIETAPPPVDYKDAVIPDPPDLPNMPDAETAPVDPATNIIVDIDLDAMVVPDKPA